MHYSLLLTRVLLLATLCYSPLLSITHYYSLPLPTTFHCPLLTLLLPTTPVSSALPRTASWLVLARTIGAHYSHLLTLLLSTTYSYSVQFRLIPRPYHPTAFQLQSLTILLRYSLQLPHCPRLFSVHSHLLIDQSHPVAASSRGSQPDLPFYAREAGSHSVRL